MLTDEKTGLKYREGTYDLAIIREMERCYGELNVRWRRVLDIGACIGAFTHWCMENDAAAVHAFEPDPDNYSLLIENTSRYGKHVCAYNIAVARGCAPEVAFYYAPGMNRGLGSLVKYRGRKSFMVQCAQFSAVVSAQQIQVIKIDIEGGEYGLFDELPDCVREVAIELHLNRPTWRKRDAPAIVDFFADWDCVKAPKISEKNWATVGVWKR